MNANRRARREPFALLTVSEIRALAAARLSPAAWATFAALATFATAANRAAHPSLAVLAARAGYRAGSVRNAVAELRRAGIVETDPPAPGRSLRYRLRAGASSPHEGDAAIGRQRPCADRGTAAMRRSEHEGDAASLHTGDARLPPPTEHEGGARRSTKAERDGARGYSTPFLADHEATTEATISHGEEKGNAFVVASSGLLGCSAGDSEPVESDGFDADDPDSVRPLDHPGDPFCLECRSAARACLEHAIPTGGAR